jgi:[pyruvate, water dikinase]-phosphate phosphotransferase / [pyruvate, water dikinase] kinase
MQHINLHLISDSTGETIGAISRAVLSQFPNIEAEEFMWSLVRTKGQIEKIAQEIKKKPGIVLYTILDKKILKNLVECCKKNDIPCIAALDEVIKSFAEQLNQKISYQTGRQHILDDEYFKKIEAINYTINHDDGQKTHELNDADIVIVGPSRTSKSPTSIYLSYRGYRTANVPFVKDIPLPQQLFELTKPLVIGFVISTDRLINIRKNRLTSLKQATDNIYVDQNLVSQEIQAAKKIYQQNNWPIIDISSKSVEENAASIIQMYKNRGGEKR